MVCQIQSVILHVGSPRCVLHVFIWICAYRDVTFVCGCCMSLSQWFCGVLALTDFCIRKLVKMSQRRKKLNSISAAAFKTTREPTNGVRNLKSWKNKLEEVLTTWERSLVLEAFLYCMIVKAPLFWALLLLCELKCWILVLCSSHEGQSFAEVRGGLYEVQWKCFLSAQSTF